MCDPITLFIAGAAATAYTTHQAKSAQQKQEKAMKKQAKKQEERARGEAFEADTAYRKERTSGYKTRRKASNAAATQTSGTAQSFGARSFFATS